MSRARSVYADAAPVTAAAAGYSADVPTAGWYRFRLVSGGHPVAVKIWHGPPHDPDTGEELDRGWRWQAQANGEPIDLDRVWPGCAREPIPAAEAEYLLGVAVWARENAPDSPQANPRKKIDLLDSATPLPF